jgi:hypothetical protein
VVRHEVFGALSTRDAALDGFRDALCPLDWPVGWIEGNGRNRTGAIDGMHVFAVSGARVETISSDGRPVGRAFDDGGARHVLDMKDRPAFDAWAAAHGATPPCRSSRPPPTSAATTCCSRSRWTPSPLRPEVW